MLVTCKNCGDTFDMVYPTISGLSYTLCECGTVISFGAYAIVNKTPSMNKYGKREEDYIDTDYTFTINNEYKALLYGRIGERLALKKLVWIGACIEDRAYGGSEEGGWWYDTCEVLEMHKAYSIAEATAIVHSLFRKYKHLDSEYPIDSVCCTGKLSIIMSDEILRSYPRVKPHYE
jgi:hypothetical protein